MQVGDKHNAHQAGFKQKHKSHSNHDNGGHVQSDRFDRGNDHYNSNHRFDDRGRGNDRGHSDPSLHNPNGTWNLTALAKKAMENKGLRTEFPKDALQQLEEIHGPAQVPTDKIISLEQWDKLSPQEKDAKRGEVFVDVRPRMSSSVDNGDADNTVTSKDLDQLEYSEKNAEGTRNLIEIADVDALVPKGSPIDQAAIGKMGDIMSWYQQVEKQAKEAERGGGGGGGRGGAGHGKPKEIPCAPGNAFSLYTPGKVYPMLPTLLSENYTSLNEGEDRVSMIADYTVGQDGNIKKEDVFRGIVHSYAAMAYPGIGAWLDPNGDGAVTEERGKMPGYLADAPAEVQTQLNMQAEATQAMKQARIDKGALTFADMETQARLNADGSIGDIELHQSTASTQLIENLMVGANGVVSRYLASKGFPTLQRVVKDPEKWDKIIETAKQIGEKHNINGELPSNPDSKALQKFLNDCKGLEDFDQISSNIIRLIGRGEYMAVPPGESPEGHFCLSVDDYSHFTAPNRRGPDLITHRMLKAAMAGEPCPYNQKELEALAAHFTAQEGNIKKAERDIEKITNAVWLDQTGQVGKEVDGVITNSNPKGTWVRATFADPDPTKAPKKIEGFLQNAGQVTSGDKLKVTLDSVDPEHARINFVPSRSA